jgi:NAD(P)-dependent dehydrogenase (short-subunit alcohol dehydrogenase family)
MSVEKKLAGRVALVTGAAKRLGRAVALRLAEQGADVAVHYGNSKDDALSLVEQIRNMGRRSSAYSADLRNIPAIQPLVDNVAKEFGRLDILINNAANFVEAKFGQTTEDTWNASLDTNLKAPFFCAQAAAPYLAKSGHGVIINFADIGGLLGWKEFLPHSISKAGVILMTRTLAKELGPSVRVNAIAPGTITMPGDPPEWQENFVKLAPLQRTGTPQDIADAVLYLLTAEFVTGHVLIVDGGRTL